MGRIPGLAGCKPASVHLRAVSAQLLDQRRWQDDGALGCLGLRLYQEQSPSGPVVALGASIEESRRVLEAAQSTVHPARWSIALSLGMRQGEVLGLLWAEGLDLDVLGPRWPRDQAIDTPHLVEGFAKHQEDEHPRDGPTVAPAFSALVADLLTAL